METECELEIPTPEESMNQSYLELIGLINRALNCVSGSTIIHTRLGSIEKRIEIHEYGYTVSEKFLKEKIMPHYEARGWEISYGNHNSEAIQTLTFRAKKVKTTLKKT